MKNEIIKLVREILNEEIFDTPFTNVKKIDDQFYQINEEGVIVDFRFKIRFDVENLIKVKKEEIDIFWEVYWLWNKEMKEELKTPKNWGRVIATSYKIINEFIEDYQPKVIHFGRQTDGNKKIYSNPNFIDKVRTIFGDKYIFISDDEKENFFLVQKELSTIYETAIKKRIQFLNESFDVAKQRVLHPNINDLKGIVKNDFIKEEEKRKQYKLTYIYYKNK